ncbi:MAG TPA: hypothetical protein VGR37_10715 [Longimicrobiaceae bacterium]|nr:hypothetical protein [Longimicrobiaceae bacterium]
MRRRFSLGRALASAVLLTLPAVACTDDPPTAGGVDLFPGGTLPATFQVVLPADSVTRLLGTFSGYTGPEDAGFLVVANEFDGRLNSNALIRLAGFPTSVTFTQGGTSKTDSVFTFGRGTLVARLDSLASTSAGPIDLQLFEVGQPWDPATVSWQFAVDTVGGRVPWTRPGGSRGALLSTVRLPAGAGVQGDSVLFALDSLTVKRISAPDFPGFLLTAAGAQGRVQLGASGIQLRTGVHPQSASPDTLVPVTVSSGALAFIFDPDQPSAQGVWEVGGIRSARTLFRLQLPRTLPVCRGGACTQVPLRQLTLNEVSLLLDPVPVPNGFRPVGPVPIAVRRVTEPELGRRAPLGAVVNQPVGLTAARTLVFGGSQFMPGDSLHVVPITSFAADLAASDSTGASLALLSDPGTLFGVPGALSFGPAWFAATPRLRIVYTAPERLVLP